MSKEIVAEWKTEAGLNAWVIFVGGTHHCGYVEVPSNLKGEDLDSYDIEVHGGVTYQDSPDWSGGVKVVGYDCAHYGDLTKCPQTLIDAGLEDLHPKDGVWRDVDYCKEQCEFLAKQLKVLDNAH